MRALTLAKLPAIAAVLSAVAIAACGTLTPGGSSSTSSSSSAAASLTAREPSSATAPSDEHPSAHGQHQLEPVPRGAAGSPQAVLHRYALLAGNLCSCSLAAGKLDEMAALATPGLATHLRAATTAARRAVARGLPTLARAIATVDTLELSPPKDATRTGLVVLLEHTISDSPTATGATPAVYRAQLLHTANGWRVASFTPVVARR
ncbi:MAG: hypothetical protein ACR2QA_03440 [Solirubrobacteraceae bacterium]